MTKHTYCISLQLIKGYFMLMAALDLDQRETSHFTACWQTLLLQHPPDCWMTASIVLSGCEALTLVGGGGGGVQRKDGDRPS